MQGMKENLKELLKVLGVIIIPSLIFMSLSYLTGSYRTSKDDIDPVEMSERDAAL